MRLEWARRTAFASMLVVAAATGLTALGVAVAQPAVGQASAVATTGVAPTTVAPSPSTPATTVATPPIEDHGDDARGAVDRIIALLVAIAVLMVGVTWSFLRRTQPMPPSLERLDAFRSVGHGRQRRWLAPRRPTPTWRSASRSLPAQPVEADPAVAPAVGRAGASAPAAAAVSSRAALGSAQGPRDAQNGRPVAGTARLRSAEAPVARGSSVPPGRPSLLPHRESGRPDPHAEGRGPAGRPPIGPPARGPGGRAPGPVSRRPAGVRPPASPAPEPPAAADG